MPPKKETSKEELERKRREELDKWEERVRSKLGKGQSPVVRGFGLVGKNNGVILIFASTFNGGGTVRGRAAPAKVHWHIAGASLNHIRGFKSCVLTADHLLAEGIKRYRGKQDYWQMEVWAMPAAQFDGLDETVTWNLHDLCEAGAVKAHGYFSLAEDKKLRLEDGRVRSGLDVAIVKLLGPMKGLSAAANQPRIMTRKGAGNVSAYFTGNGAPKVVIMVEGRGLHTSSDGQDTNTKKEKKSQQKSKRQIKREKKGQLKKETTSQQKNKADEKKKADTSVTWTKLQTVSWTSTKITGMAPRQFGVGIQLATWKLPLEYAGELRIFEAYVPRGSGVEAPTPFSQPGRSTPTLSPMLQTFQFFSAAVRLGKWFMMMNSLPQSFTGKEDAKCCRVSVSSSPLGSPT